MKFQLLGVYSISKTALLALCKTTADELACEGIRVNCIAPGVIKTKFSQPVRMKSNIVKKKKGKNYCNFLVLRVRVCWKSYFIKHTNAKIGITWRNSSCGSIFGKWRFILHHWRDDNCCWWHEIQTLNHYYKDEVQKYRNIFYKNLSL